MEQQQNSIIKILEKHFKDVVDVSFVIQEGKLWILDVRPSKRTGKANIKINVDLYKEQIINENDVISRIRLTDIMEVLHPIINNECELKCIAEGLPASPGVATGKVFFTSNDITENKEHNSILCKIEVSPDDIQAMTKSSATITSRGGMISHAAVILRGMGKCCVTGIGNLNIDYRERKAMIDNFTIKEGEWITINGSNGKMYYGKGIITSKPWYEDHDLYFLSKIVEKAIRTDSISVNNIGKAWLIRDFFFHNIPFFIYPTKKQNIEIKQYKSFLQPKPFQIKKIYSILNELSQESETNKFVIIGLRNSLLRQLGNIVGIGNHYKYYRPILDPMLCIISDNISIKKQLIGEEFFNISKYLPNYIDIYKVKLYTQIQANSEGELSFLDCTNIKGESLVIRSNNIKKFYLEINDQRINIDRLATLYNIFRKREYFWNWYFENFTTHQEMIDFLNKSKDERIKDFRLNTYAHELELLENDILTNSGQALIS
ncbi:Pyruvate phosphate dikinase [termite gut metagenome]|uniref:Pyruvate phosphate dikinase n=1 Tax=termite gut metagenome TaxID=433724 RepID=A0A5J4QMK2_9ZZZZ